jgi:hypothetical protein
MIGKIYKNGVIVGDCKNLQTSIVSIIETCKFFNFNIAEYEIQDFYGNSLWSGTNEDNDKGNND